MVATFTAAEEIVIANTTGEHIGIFDFYRDRAAAAADLDRARAFWQREPRDYRVMTYQEYNAAERAYFLDRPIQRITRARFWDMLECLPPRNYVVTPNWVSFTMSEHTSGPYTEQYVRVGPPGARRYFCKVVDTWHQETWITPEMIADLNRQRRRDYIASLNDTQARRLGLRAYRALEQAMGGTGAMDYATARALGHGDLCDVIDAALQRAITVLREQLATLPAD